MRERSGKSNYNTDFEIEIGEGEIFKIAIEIDIEISVISMILRLPEILEIMPTRVVTHLPPHAFHFVGGPEHTGP